MRTPGIQRLKREARAAAAARGHVLGRFRTQHDQYRPPYYIAFCQGCGRPAAVAPDRWGNRHTGGHALRDEACPRPLPPEAIDVIEDRDDDDQELEVTP